MFRWLAIRSVTSCSPMKTRPASGRSKPATIRSVVVFPQPEGPSSVRNSPGCTARLMSLTAYTSPFTRWLNCFDSCWIRMPTALTSAS